MDIVRLKETIIRNADNYIPIILEQLNCINIRNFTKEFRCSDNNHTSLNGIKVYKDTLHTKSYYDNWQGDILTLVEKFKNCSFKSAIGFICQWLGITDEITRLEITLPFGGYYKGIKVNRCDNDTIETYEDNILDKYYNVPNQRFLKDGISLETQLKFGVRYDLETDRILIPWWNTENELVGIIGRSNNSTKYIKENGIAKYFPIISFPKSKVLYGLNKNYNSILEQKIVIVGEAEKMVMQLASMKIHTGVALGSHNISDEQVKLIHSMFPEKIIVAFDEGVSRSELEQTCNKLQYNNAFFKCKVGYIYDGDNKYLKKESKQSPTDLGMELFKNLMKECVVWC